MSTLTTTYTFTASTLAKAAEVNQNFTDIRNYVNTNAIVKDASLAFTSIPSGPASDPSTADQFTRKAYVNAQDAVVAGTVTTLDTKVESYGRSLVIDPKTKNSGGTSALLVASGPWNTFTTISDFDSSIPEITGHWYRVTMFWPQLHTNKDAILSTVGTRVITRVRRAGTAIARGYCMHDVDDKGDTCIAQAYVLSSATASVAYDVQVAHLYDEAGGGSDAAIRYNADTSWPAFFSVEDMGTTP